jgi:peroxiredoxin
MNEKVDSISISPQMKNLVSKWKNNQELPPTNTMIVESALKMFLQSKGVQIEEEKKEHEEETRTTSVTISVDLKAALMKWNREQEIEFSQTAITNAALKMFLKEKGVEIEGGNGY